MVYSSGSIASDINLGTVAVVAGITYTIQFEILRNDLGSAAEKVKNVMVGDDGGTLTDLGSCNPDGGDYDCTFFDCIQSHAHIVVHISLIAECLRPLDRMKV